MKVIAYKTFETSDEFIEWQKEEVPEIIGVQPFLTGADMSMDASYPSEQEGNFNVKTGVFVTYFADVTK